MVKYLESSINGKSDSSSLDHTEDVHLERGGQPTPSECLFKEEFVCGFN